MRVVVISCHLGSGGKSATTPLGHVLSYMQRLGTIS